MTNIPDALLDLVHAAADRAGLDLTRDVVAADAARGSWYADLALKAFDLGARSRPDLPAVTLPWAGDGFQVDCDEHGEIIVHFDLGAGDFSADEVTEAAAALLAAAHQSRDITGKRPAPAALSTLELRWDLQIKRGDEWVIRDRRARHRGVDPHHLAHLIADQHLVDRPAELVDVPWRVLVWYEHEADLTPENAIGKAASADALTATAGV